MENEPIIETENTLLFPLYIACWKQSPLTLIPFNKSIELINFNISIQTAVLL